ncbi:DUF4349 domain-containing protein [Rhodobacter xanthinilyticus]|uniref:hypothetical protein n=1 Tax=Rhodobacter xanthinilyticus TaxID=1850250 RepID=UPI0012EBECB1|nr:hypothetical protein [Rhodobacter xanthinilyticus]
MSDTKSEELVHLSEERAHLRAQEERLRELIRKRDSEVAQIDERLSALQENLLALQRAKKVLAGLQELAEATVAALKAGNPDLPALLHSFEEAAEDAKRFMPSGRDIDGLIPLARAMFHDAARRKEAET